MCTVQWNECDGDTSEWQWINHELNANEWNEYDTNELDEWLNMNAHLSPLPILFIFCRSNNGKF